MQRKHWPQAIAFVLAVAAATAILVAAGLGERTGKEHTASSKATVTARQ